MSIIGKYNFDDANQRGGFIRDLISEFPEDENRKALLEELDKFIDDIEEQSEDFESTIDSLHDEIADAERENDDLQSENDEAEEKIAKLTEQLEEAKNGNSN